jgi:hypothetical protein
MFERSAKDKQRYKLTLEGTEYVRKYLERRNQCARYDFEMKDCFFSGYKTVWWTGGLRLVEFAA